MSTENTVDHAYCDDLQARLESFLKSVVDDPERGVEGTRAWIGAAKSNYRKDARLGRLTEESVREVLQRLEQAEGQLVMWSKTATSGERRARS